MELSLFQIIGFAILLIILGVVLHPFFDSFEAFGVSLKTRRKEKVAENIRDKYQQKIANAETISSKKGGKK